MAVKKQVSGDLTHLVIPSVIGSVIAWFFSGSAILGIAVFIGVYLGNWIGYKILNK